MNNLDNFADNFSKAYKQLYAMHPRQEEDIFNLRYLHVKWFFPNHLHNVLINIVKFRKKFFPEANIEAALYGGLFHDAGLVYKRDTSNPAGHENRSVEFASLALKNLNYDDKFVELVSECIKATEPEYDSSVPEAVLVKNADAYSHITSIHFFAKANFAKDIYSYVPWFEKKFKTSVIKLTIPNLKTEIKPIYDSYNIMIENYKNNNLEKDNFLELLFNKI